MKYLKIKIFFFISLLFLMSGCTSTDARTSDNTFKVGMTVGYPPFNWTQKNGDNGAVKVDGSIEYASGYDVDMAKKIAEGLGKELVIVKTEWDGLIPALTSGKIDAVIAGMSPSKERKKVINFTDSYYDAELVMVVLKGSKYESAQSLEDFEGAKVTGQLNTFHYKALDQLTGTNKEVAVDSAASMRVALQSKVIDAYISDLPEGLSAELATPDFKLVELTDGFRTTQADTIIAVGLAKSNQDLAAINRILAGITPEERDEMMREAVKRQPALAFSNDSNS